MLLFPYTYYPPAFNQTYIQHVVVTRKHLTFEKGGLMNVVPVNTSVQTTDRKKVAVVVGELPELTDKDTIEVKDSNPTDNTKSTENLFLARLLKTELPERGEELSFNSFIGSFVTTAFKQNLYSFPIQDISKIQDPKTDYIPAILTPESITNDKATTLASISVQKLPKLSTDGSGVRRITEDVDPNSFIWLPEPFIIGGSFHPEIYPHDTSLAIWELLELARYKSTSPGESHLEIIRQQFENFKFQIENFGFPLNGNRGYFITRSQTNNIPSNILQYYEVTQNKPWLKTEGLPIAESIFNYWTSKIAEIETSNGKGYRWIAHGKGPCIEVTDSHKEHNFYYFKVLEELVKYSLIEDNKRPDFAREFDYTEVIEVVPKISKSKLVRVEDLNLENTECFYFNNEPIVKHKGIFYKLTEKYYLNDRASRVSGYDTNHLYGPFNSFTYDFIPADHNMFLYKHAKDIAQMHRVLENFQKANEYEKKAVELKRMIMATLWDENMGYFFDYNAKLKKLRTEYPFASAAYALTANIFDINKPNEYKQLIRLVKYLEEELEGPEGFYASNKETGLHWDKPYTWPVQQAYIVGGLRDYAKKLQDIQDYKNSNNLTHIADRISVKYLFANYNSWLNSKGNLVGEKIAPSEENLLTGYSTGSNYTWNLTTVLYLYRTLSEPARTVFDSIVNQ